MENQDTLDQSYLINRQQEAKQSDPYNVDQPKPEKPLYSKVLDWIPSALSTIATPATDLLQADQKAGEAIVSKVTGLDGPKGVGDAVFDKTGSPILAAGAKTLADLATPLNVIGGSVGMLRKGIASIAGRVMAGAGKEEVIAAGLNEQTLAETIHKTIVDAGEMLKQPGISESAAIKRSLGLNGLTPSDGLVQSIAAEVKKLAPDLQAAHAAETATAEASTAGAGAETASAEAGTASAGPKASTLDELQAKFKAALSDAHGGVRHDPEVHAEADANIAALSPEDRINFVKSIGFNEPQNDVHATQMLKIVSDEGNKAIELAKAVTADQATHAEFLKQIQTMSEIIPPQAGAESAVGRGLRQIGVENPSPNFSSSQFAKSFSLVLQSAGGEGMSVERLAQMVSEIDPLAAPTFAIQAKSATSMDMLLEVFINGMLSSPKTHAANFISNAATQIWSVPENWLAKGIGKLTGTVSAPGEEMARLKGIGEGLRDSLKYVAKSIEQGKPQYGTNVKFGEQTKAITGENLGLSGLPGRAVDYLGNFVRAPGSAMLYGDEFFHGIAYRTELRVLANRTAYERAAAQGLEGDAFTAEYNRINADILNNPETYTTVADDAHRMAAYQTFNRDLEGFGTGAQKWVKDNPAGKFILPFVRTPVNLFKWAGERTPLGLLSSNVRAEIAAGGARRDLALAKMAFGSSVGGLLAGWAAEGHLTGGGPSDQKLLDELKQTGWEPYAFHYTDGAGKEQYLSYARLQPIATVFGLHADARDILRDYDNLDADKLAGAVLAATQRNISNATFVQGLARAATVLGSKDPAQWQQFLDSFVPSFIPASGLVRSVKQAFTDNEQKDFKSEEGMLGLVKIWAEIKATIPGLSDTVYAKRNAWGEKLAYRDSLGPEILSPIYVSVGGQDKTLEALVSREIAISAPSRVLQGKNGPHLTAEQYDALGEIIRTTEYQGRTLKQAMTDLVTDQQWQEASQETKKNKVSELATQYHKAAVQDLRAKYPDLDTAMNAAGLEKRMSSQDNATETKHKTQAGIPSGIGIEQGAQ